MQALAKLLCWSLDSKVGEAVESQQKQFAEQREHGFEVWGEPFVFLRVPRLINLRADPFERAMTESIGYDRYMIDHLFMLVPAQSFVAEFLATFKDFPPRQTPSSFTIDQVLEWALDS